MEGSRKNVGFALLLVLIGVVIIMLIGALTRIWLENRKEHIGFYSNPSRYTVVRSEKKVINLTELFLACNDQKNVREHGNELDFDLMLRWITRENRLENHITTRSWVFELDKAGKELVIPVYWQRTDVSSWPVEDLQNHRLSAVQQQSGS